MTESKVFNLVELKHMDLKSPLRIFLGLSLFIVVLLLGIMLTGRLPKALDFFSEIIIVGAFFSAMSLSQTAGNWLLPHKPGMMLKLTEHEIVLLSPGFETKIANQNLSRKKQFGSKFIVFNSAGQSLKLPSTVGLMSGPQEHDSSDLDNQDENSAHQNQIDRHDIAHHKADGNQTDQIKALRIPKLQTLPVADLNFMYNLDVLDGKVVLRKTTLNFSSKGQTKTEIVPFHSEG